MSSSAKPTIDKSKLLALAKNVTKSKLIAKNNNNSTQPIKVHRRIIMIFLFQRKKQN